MKGCVYILEDDADICGLIKVALEMNDICFEAFSKVSEFTAALTFAQPDVALLDIMLPDGNGFEVLKFVKNKYPEVSCIMLSALSKEEDKVNGLNLGADDYVAKPFSVLELTARINTQLRRRRKEPVLKAGGITLNTETMTASAEGRALTLNKKEYELLKYLMENAGKVLSREKLLTKVWGYESGETRTLDNHIARLRKLGVKIDTIFGVGYRMSGS